MSERAELSKKNRNYISKDRYYELKHYCLQYNTWREAAEHLDSLSKRPDLSMYVKPTSVGDPVTRTVMARESFLAKMKIVDQAAIQTDPDVGPYIFKAVTEGLSYDQMAARNVLPCSRQVYYNLYRLFFWNLSRLRN